MKFIPEYNPAEIKNKGESFIFNELNKSLEYSDTIVFYSILIPRHIYKIEGEMDFILLGSFGILCLEVKGGEVTRTNGVWTITDGIKSYTSKEGPFKQASSGMNSLKNDLITYFEGKGKNTYLPFGYGVLFVDTEFSIKSAEWDNDIIYKASDRNNSIDAYLKRLVHYWNNKNKNHRLLQEDISMIETYFRGNIKLNVSIIPYIQDTKEKIIEFTKEQTDFISGIYSNSRLLIDGPAGTGKTICAQRYTILKAAEGKRIGYFCFNILLSYSTKQIFEFSDFSGNISCSDIINFVFSYIKKNNIDIQDLEKSNVTIIEKRKLLFQEFINNFKEEEKFDTLVIDEGQDIINEEYYDLLNSLVKGGIKNGEWVIFYDSEIQSGMYENFDRDVLSIIKEDARPSLFQLKKNCRNSLNIIDTIQKVTDFPIEPNQNLKGEQVIFIPYKNDLHQKEEVFKILDQLKKQNVPSSTIDILSFCEAEKSIYKKFIADFKKHKVLEFSESSITNRKQEVFFTSIGKYKGLENDIILLTDYSYNDEKKNRVLTYTAMSRARTLLYIFINIADYEKIKRKYANAKKG